MIELLIINGSIAYKPVLTDDVKWTTERKCSPGKLEFTVINDDKLSFQEGNAVKMSYNGTPLFYGYVFTKKRNSDGKIKVTAYDQLRYFKNKDTYQYTSKTASQLLKMIAADFGLRTGSIEDSGYIISKRLESNKTLFDIVQNALDLTMTNTKQLYVMYDDVGAIALKNIASMKIGLLICDETAQSFDYTTSIDSDTYNQVKLVYENKETGKRDIYLAKDSDNINRWGILQYFEELDDGENGAYKTSQLLEYYNQKSRKLTVKGCFGDVRMRAGCSPMVQLNLGDMIVNNFMVADKVVHSFSESTHTMDLTLIGNEFV